MSRAVHNDSLDLTYLLFWCLNCMGGFNTSLLTIHYLWTYQYPNIIIYYICIACNIVRVIVLLPMPTSIASAGELMRLSNKEDEMLCKVSHKTKERSRIVPSIYLSLLRRHLTWGDGPARRLYAWHALLLLCSTTYSAP